MIPLQYRLRDAVRLEPVAGGQWRVVCDSPVSVLTINRAAARMLEQTRPGATIGEIVTRCGMDEERTFSLCEHFRRLGILDVARSPLDEGPAPTVTIVVPVLDRVDELDECLEALNRLDYPRDRVEVFVVDDGSADPADIAAVADKYGARLFVNERNQGPAYSRNRAVAEASGEIVAFTDSDCVVSTGWLRELTSYFAWVRVGAVGGRTIGYYSMSSLDRYEEVSSPLDMGRHLRLEAKGLDTFYVPTCNLLVRRLVYRALGGLREDLRMGEDVDLCWRLRAEDHYLVYAPEGIVQHKHRNDFGSMLLRRAAYGSSEATLYSLHPEKRKQFPREPVPLATAALLSAAVIGRKRWLLVAGMASVLWDADHRSRRLRNNGIALPGRTTQLSVARGHLSMLYFVYFHLVRYYLGPVAAAGVLSDGLRRLVTVAALYAATVDYVTKRPRLDYLTYLGYFLAEHGAYQAGVIAGCFRAGTFRSYRVTLAGSR